MSLIIGLRSRAIFLRPVISHRFGTPHQETSSSSVRDRHRSRVVSISLRFAQNDRYRSINVRLTLMPIRRRSIYISSTPAVVRQMRAQIGRSRCCVPLFLQITCLPTCNYGRFHRAFGSVARSRNDTSAWTCSSVRRTPPGYGKRLPRSVGIDELLVIPGTKAERIWNHHRRNLSPLPEIDRDTRGIGSRFNSCATRTLLASAIFTPTVFALPRGVIIAPSVPARVRDEMFLMSNFADGLFQNILIGLALFFFFSEQLFCIFANYTLFY